MKDGLIEQADVAVAAGVVAAGEAPDEERLVEALEVGQGLGGQQGADLLEGALEAVAELGARQRRQELLGEEEAEHLGHRELKLGGLDGVSGEFPIAFALVSLLIMDGKEVLQDGEVSLHGAFGALEAGGARCR